MKKASVLTILVTILCSLTFVLSGCFNPPPLFPESAAQLGETTAEGKRRHIRRARLNQQMLMEDVDELFHLNEPSRLTDKRMP